MFIIVSAEKRRILWLNQKQPSEMFFKKGVLRNFTKLTAKHL